MGKRNRDEPLAVCMDLGFGGALLFDPAFAVLVMLNRRNENSMIE